MIFTIASILRCAKVMQGCRGCAKRRDEHICRPLWSTPPQQRYSRVMWCTVTNKPARICLQLWVYDASTPPTDIDPRLSATATPGISLAVDVERNFKEEGFLLACGYRDAALYGVCHIRERCWVRPFASRHSACWALHTACWASHMRDVYELFREIHAGSEILCCLVAVAMCEICPVCEGSG